MRAPPKITPEIGDFLDSLQPIAAEIGVAATSALCEQFGGSRLYIPQKWRADLELNILDEEVARHLCKMFGPERIELPKQPLAPIAMRRIASRLRAEGHSYGAIARALKLSHRTAVRFSRGAGAIQNRRAPLDARQLNLNI